MRQLLLITIIYLKASTSVMLAIIILLESTLAYEMTAMVISKNILSSLNYLLDIGLITINLPQKDIEQAKYWIKYTNFSGSARIDLQMLNLMEAD